MLKGLRPIDIFRLYNKAIGDNDYEMQVALIQVTDEVDRNKLVQEIKSVKASQENEMKLMESYKNFQGKIFKKVRHVELMPERYVTTAAPDFYAIIPSPI